MGSLFWRCIREYLWRAAHARSAARVLAEAEAALAAGAPGRPERLAELRAYPWWEVRNAALKLTALETGGSADALLCGLLHDRTDVGIVRRNAAAALGARPASPASAAALRRGAADPYWEVRREAVWALARVDPRSEATFDALRAAARRERASQVRMALARALGATGNPEALEPLELLSTAASWLVRLQSAVALAELAAAVPAHRERVRAVLARMERSSEGLTGRMVLADRMAVLDALLDTERWPAAGAVASLYFSPGTPWTRQ
ncbi:MAG TPA: HEAT repeat domain-containing protein [Planctomycetota bacterium]|jgi:HEAT repeat protein|nr:MAG: HEAT repeat protein [Planctomycetes bacterium ADurb.Bin069]HNR99208.1 HEAT repeat domain-containing protein [Planctomycetota bacterium]HOE86858.1 HEAT repeat domain-containing protein [Planctomycetota bacterium]HOR68614.1 HEAT repeat domain-containing protein [Planctomycetota bacterium]HQF65741.1 HEAT repeat domain-containing protein [Planctomycetota bacterium]